MQSKNFRHPLLLLPLLPAVLPLIACRIANTDCHPADAVCNEAAILLYAAIVDEAASGYRGYAAVGDQGLVLLSSDGDNWERITAFTNSTLNALAAGNGTLVAAGSGNELYYSRNGREWVRSETTAGFALTRMVFVENKFYAMGGSSDMLESADGLDWTLITTGLSDTVSDYGIRASDGIRAVSFSAGGNSFASTADAPGAQNWTPVNLGFLSIGVLTYGDRFYFLHDANRLIQSTDDFGSYATSIAGIINTVDFTPGDGKLVAVSAPNIIGTSATGTETNWPNIGASGCGGGSPIFAAIAYGNSKYVIGGAESGSGVICLSTTGEPGSFQDAATLTAGLAGITDAVYSSN